MKHRIITLLVIFTLVLPTCSLGYGETSELTEPIQPEINETLNDNESILASNHLIEQYNEEVKNYNSQVDEKYAADMENYNKEVQEVEKHNQEEENRAAQIEEQNQAEQARIEAENAAKEQAETERVEAAKIHNEEEDKKVEEVNAHNQAEDELVQKSQEEIAKVEQKIEQDKPQESLFEHYTYDSEELPSDWTDVTTNELKTIDIHKSDNPVGELVSIMNLHIFVTVNELIGPSFVGGANLTNDHFEITEKTKEAMLFAEWETAQMDLNDSVTLKSEAEFFKNNTIYHEGKNYRYQPYYNLFMRNIEGYTQGSWGGSAGVATNANTFESEWGYNFETGEGKGGDIYNIEYNPKTILVPISVNGKIEYEEQIVRTIDRAPIANILSVFVYFFQRNWEEPKEYQPDYQNYEPQYEDETFHVDYEEFIPKTYTKDIWELPNMPTKLPYLNFMDLLELIKESSTPTKVRPVVKSKTPAPVTYVQQTPARETYVEEPIKEEVVKNVIPKTVNSKPTGSWALINLISMLLTILLSFILLISLIINKITQKEDEKVNNRVIVRIATIILAVISLIIFIFTENMLLPMVLIDKWTIVMILILIVQLILTIASKHKVKEEEDENNEE